MRGLALLLLGVAALGVAFHGKRRAEPAVTVADDDASDWYLAAEPVAGAFCGFIYLHDRRRREGRTH